jgi:sensor domain CHASE-containing protein
MGLHVNQAEQVRSLITAHTEGIRMEVETALRSNVNALERMARTWEKFGRPSKEEWLFNADLILKNIKGFRGC